MWPCLYFDICFRVGISLTSFSPIHLLQNFQTCQVCGRPGQCRSAAVPRCIWRYRRRCSLSAEVARCVDGEILSSSAVAIAVLVAVFFIVRGGEVVYCTSVDDDCGGFAL